MAFEVLLLHTLLGRYRKQLIDEERDPFIHLLICLFNEYVLSLYEMVRQECGCWGTVVNKTDRPVLAVKELMVGVDLKQ